MLLKLYQIYIEGKAHQIFKPNEVIGIINQRVYQRNPINTELISTNFSYAIALKMIAKLLRLVKTNDRFKDISSFKDISEFEEKPLELDSDFILYNYKEKNNL